ncbi:hypothetical protein [Pseudomonas phage Almagne]|nr:hypothetical protein [Pseudomonas phage Almagne]
MRYNLEILYEDGVSVKAGDVSPKAEHNLRFWTGIENHQFDGECVVLGDVSTIKEFIRVFDGGYFEEFKARWRGPERCRLVITR